MSREGCVGIGVSKRLLISCGGCVISFAGFACGILTAWRIEEIWVLIWAPFAACVFAATQGMLLVNIFTNASRTWLRWGTAAMVCVLVGVAFLFLQYGSGAEAVSVSGILAPAVPAVGAVLGVHVIREFGVCPRKTN